MCQVPSAHNFNVISLSLIFPSTEFSMLQQFQIVYRYNNTAILHCIMVMSGNFWLVFFVIVLPTYLMSCFFLLLEKFMWLSKNEHPYRYT
jgi:hypothetical protein